MSDSANSILRRVGQTELPYSGGDVVATEGAITDPLQEFLLELFKTVIIDEFQDAFSAASAGTPLAGKSVIEDTWSGLLTPEVMKQRKGGFPLLSVGWTGSAEWAEHTLGIDKCTRKWVVNYVLGPLDVASAQRLDKLPHRIAVLLQLVLRNRGHKAFQAGATIWGSDTEGRPSTIWLDSHEAGQASFATDGAPLYYALTVMLTTVENDADLNLYPDLTGATITADLLDADGTTIDGFIVGETEHTPPYS